MTLDKKNPQLTPFTIKYNIYFWSKMRSLQFDFSVFIYRQALRHKSILNRRSNSFNSPTEKKD